MRSYIVEHIKQVGHVILMRYIVEHVILMCGTH